MKEIEHNGVKYRSAVALAHALEMHPRTVRYHLAKHGHLKLLGTGTGKCREPGGCPVEHDGVTYRSQAALARHLKVDPSAVRYHLDRYGHTDNLGIGTGHNPASRATQMKGRVMRIGQHKFPSIRAAAKFLGIKESTLRMRIKRWSDGDQARIMEDYARATMENAT